MSDWRRCRARLPITGPSPHGDVDGRVVDSHRGRSERPKPLTGDVQCNTKNADLLFEILTQTPEARICSNPCLSGWITAHARSNRASHPVTSAKLALGDHREQTEGTSWARRLVVEDVAVRVEGISSGIGTVCTNRGRGWRSSALRYDSKLGQRGEDASAPNVAFAVINHHFSG